MTSRTDSRNRHDRLESHWGDLPTDLVEIDSEIMGLPAGTTLQALLVGFEAALQALEAPAVIPASGTITLDASIVATQAASFELSGGISKTTTGSLSLDAWIRTAFSLDAVLSRVMAASFTLDSTIGDVGEAMSMMLGEASLGETGLGEA
jgi:hypothetical protein